MNEPKSESPPNTDLNTRQLLEDEASGITFLPLSADGEKRRL